MTTRASERKSESVGTADRWLVACVIAVALFLVVFVTTGVKLGNVSTGDTDALVSGARVAVECLKEAVLVGCGHPPHSSVSSVYPYPLLQYIPAAIMVALGFSDKQTLLWLAHLNTVVFFALIAFVVVPSRRTALLRLWAPELLVVLLAGPMLFYASAGFGEMLAAFAAVLAIGAVIARRPLLAAAGLAFACLGKETLAPFLLMLALVCGRDAEDGWLPSRRMLVPIGFGVGTGALLTVCFNVFRFGATKNLVYLEPRFRTPRRLVLDFFAQLWVAPSGGLMWFWFSACVIFLLIGVSSIRSFRRGTRYLRLWLPPFVVLAVLVLFQAGLAHWGYPFGWIAWGPRLTVPIVPVALVAGLYVGGTQLRLLVDRALRSAWVAAIVAVVLGVSALPQAGSVWAYDRATTALLAGDRTCPGLLELPGNGEARESYFPCARHIAWRSSPSNLVSPVRIRRPEGRVGQPALVASVVLLVIVAHRRARRRFRLANEASD